MAVAMKKQVGKKKRVSKKKKIAWRKHCDTDDVDQYLEEIRHEERVGIKFSEVEDNQLFFEDVAPLEKAKQDNQNILQKRKENKVPRCFEILLPHTAVPDPISKRNRVRTPEERKHPYLRQKEAQRKAEGILTAKERSALQNRIFQAEKDKNKPKRGEFKFDIWAETDEKEPEGYTEWVNPVTVRHNLINTRKFKKSVPKTVRKKTSALPAVEPPHPGLSYNPTYKDYQTLLQEIADEELELEKKEQNLKRATVRMFSQVTEKQNEAAWLSEMSEGLPKVDDTVEIKDEKDEYPNEYKAINPPVRDKKKSRAKRNSLLRAKQEQDKRKLVAIEKKKITDIYRLKKIAKSLEEEELKSLKRQAALNKKKALKEFEARRLSRVKFEPADKEFILPKDLSGDLRGIQQDGNLLNDRFKSLQKRNILPASVKRNPPKQAKKKKFTKGTHKVTDEDVLRKCKM